MDSHLYKDMHDKNPYYKNNIDSHSYYKRSIVKIKIIIKISLYQRYALSFERRALVSYIQRKFNKAYAVLCIYDDLEVIYIVEHTYDDLGII